MSHAELDEAPELDAGRPGGARAGLPRADGACCRGCGCSAAAAAPTIATSGRSAMPAASSPRGLSRRLRPATPADAADLARLVDLASEGLARRFWAEHGRAGRGRLRGRRAARRARRGGLLLAQRGDRRDRRRGGGRAGQPTASATRPSRSRGCRRSPGRCVELENRALGTHYVNVLATYPAFRGRGVATALLRHAARAAGRGGAEPDRRRRQRRGAAALRGLRLRRAGAAADRQGRAGRARAGSGC